MTHYLITASWDSRRKHTAKGQWLESQKQMAHFKANDKMRLRIKAAQ
ncbi:hypothetical protein OAH36_00595 [Verrucomicrobia bacterium]|nr:hypothetical protein [Verrucomicrobiota bacterium]MDB4798074.1 hypothetical protein [Verrucomicrobiota bacterium]